jgi:capsid protein
MLSSEHLPLGKCETLPNGNEIVFGIELDRFGRRVLAGALELPGFASDPAPYLPVKWIPPKWDWVDPLPESRRCLLTAIEQRGSALGYAGGAVSLAVLSLISPGRSERQCRCPRA